MIERIISGGQTGSDRAALEYLQLEIVHILDEYSTPPKNN